MLYYDISSTDNIDDKVQSITSMVYCIMLNYDTNSTDDNDDKVQPTTLRPIESPSTTILSQRYY